MLGNQPSSIHTWVLTCVGSWSLLRIYLRTHIIPRAHRCPCSPSMDPRLRGPILLGTELSYDPTIPLLGIYAKKTLVQKDTCTPMFIAALFTRAKTQKQPKYASTDEWLKMCIHSGIFLTMSCPMSSVMSDSLQSHGL